MYIFIHTHTQACKKYTQQIITHKHAYTYIHIQAAMPPPSPPCHIHAPLVLPVQVVPTALLEMSRSVMRERFSSLVTKPIYTFVFERQAPVTQVGRGGGARVQDPLCLRGRYPSRR